MECDLRLDLAGVWTYQLRSNRTISTCDFRSRMPPKNGGKKKGASGYVMPDHLDPGTVRLPSQQYRI